MELYLLLSYNDVPIAISLKMIIFDANQPNWNNVKSFVIMRYINTVYIFDWMILKTNIVTRYLGSYTVPMNWAINCWVRLRRFLIARRESKINNNTNMFYKYI